MSETQIEQRAGEAAPGAAAGEAVTIERPRRRASGRLRRELASFGLVGTIGFLLDVAVFTLLHTTGVEVILAKAIAVLISSLSSWALSRWWTFRHRRERSAATELGLFLAANGLGLLVSVLCLGVSHYLLGLTSVLADNISANLIGGILLGSVVRFFAYRQVVFPRSR